MTHVLRKPCGACGNERGRIETRSGQDCLFCEGCGKWQYNAPKTETGRAVRTTQTTHDAITPKLRSKILIRANGRCEMCGKPATECVMHVGHLVSVKFGHEAGLTDEQINNTENLSAMCDECNLGIGSQPMPLRFALMMLLQRDKFLKGAHENQF